MPAWQGAGFGDSATYLAEFARMRQAGFDAGVELTKRYAIPRIESARDVALAAAAADARWDRLYQSFADLARQFSVGSDNKVISAAIGTNADQCRLALAAG